MLLYASEMDVKPRMSANMIVSRPRLASELQVLRVLGQLLDQRGREVLPERGLHAAALAVDKAVAEQQHAAAGRR